MDPDVPQTSTDRDESVPPKPLVRTPAGYQAPGHFGSPELVLLAILSLVWGAAYVLIRQGLLLGASPLPFAAVRYALAAGAFAAIAIVAKSPLPSRRELWISASVGGVVIIGLYGGLLYWGEQYTTGGYAAVLASTAPLLTVAFGFLILRAERLSSRGLLGMVVGFAGTAVLVVPQLIGTSIGSPEGPIFILAAMACAAGGTVLLRRIGGGPQGLWQIGAQFGVAAGMLGAGSFLLPVPRSLPLSVDLWAILAGLVIFSSVIGYFAYFALHHRLGPVRANLVAYLVPLAGLALGTGLLAEPVTGWELAGVAIVLAGVTLVLWDSNRAPVRARTS